MPQVPSWLGEVVQVFKRHKDATARKRGRLALDSDSPSELMAYCVFGDCNSYKAVLPGEPRPGSGRALIYECSRCHRPWYRR